ncbi:MAG: cytochrome c biogenesis protein CcdA [Elusimicrobia bacterium]|nr:cytochrome c biogenesis protein CcdA [Candidatus Liberimonas magnetica]
MILKLFNWLSGMLYAAPSIALTGSFIWGIMSILLSPCHLSSIPLIIGFINGQGRVTTKRAFILSFLFSSGILITIGAIGVITGLSGRMLGDIGNYGNYLVAAIFLVVGLYLLDVVSLPFLNNSSQPSFAKKGLLASFVLGLFFGLALGPCTFAYMMPILGVAFSVAKTNMLFSVSLVLAYALGHISVIVFAGTFTETVQNYLDWNEKSKAGLIIKKVCGLLVIAGGVYLAVK